MRRITYSVNGFSNKKNCYANAIPLILAALIAVGIIVIGCFYFVSPERILGTFGLTMLHQQMLLRSLAYRYTMSMIVHIAYREVERRRR